MRIFNAHNSSRALAFVCALIAIAATSQAGAAAAPTTSQRTIAGIPIPASTKLPGSTATTTTPTATAATPASGAQPGTVAPDSRPSLTTPTTSVPTTTTAPPVATTPATVAPATTNPTSTTPASPPGTPTVVGVARKSTSSSTHLSNGALALAILGALLALGCAVWVVGRWMAIEPRWTVSTMHSLREATYHASATWAEFSDWAKLGR